MSKEAAGAERRRAWEGFMTIINTGHDTVAARAPDGTEYVAIPNYEDKAICVYKVKSGEAAKITGFDALPHGAVMAEEISMHDCKDAAAVRAKCERLIASIHRT